YDNLVLFDRQGRVLAVSNPDYQSYCGKLLGDEWVRSVLGLKNSQSYTVSLFAPSGLYRNRHTYIYGAALYDMQDDGKAVGGIGIVFDSAPQFEAMLKDALPRNENGEIIPGSFGVFADRERNVISSTRNDIPPGSRLDVDEKFFAMSNGEGISSIIEYGGHYYAVGSRISSGYREFKDAHDGYRNDVAALIFVPLCPASAEHARARVERPRMQLQMTRSAELGDAVEIATFYVGENWFGLHSDNVVEAIDLSGLTHVPGAASYLVGYVLHHSIPIPVVNIQRLLPQIAASQNAFHQQIVLVRHKENSLFGILVDSLGEIPEVARSRVEMLSSMFSGEGVIADSLVKPDASQQAGELLLILNPDRICQRIAFLKGQEAEQSHGANANVNVVKGNVTKLVRS
ncbi:MAG: chemotaxis protein CheW, partial [Nitrospirae bacterium]